MKYYCMFITVVCALLMSCRIPQPNGRTNDPKDIIGSTLLIPENGKWLCLEGAAASFPSEGPSMIVYFDASGCAPCALKELWRWKEIVEGVDSLNRVAGSESGIIFIMHAKADDPALISALSEHDFHYPVMCDERGEFEASNIIMANNRMNTFLVGSDNKIVMVGSPLLGRNMKTLFLHTLFSID